MEIISKEWEERRIQERRRNVEDKNQDREREKKHWTSDSNVI